MPVSLSLRRLLKLRQLEEEQARAALDSALLEQHRLQAALAGARMHERAGRARIIASAHTGDSSDRMAGLIETEAARRTIALLKKLIAETDLTIAGLRQEYLARRIERRQAETLHESQQSIEDVQRSRREQQQLDDWHGARRHRSNSTATTDATIPRHSDETHESNITRNDTFHS